MKKLFTSCFVVTSLVLSPALKAEELESSPTVQSEKGEDSPAVQSENMEDAPTFQAEDTEDSKEGTPVGQASNEGVNAAKKKRWTNYAIAAGAVAIAVAALILVANNNGHESD